MPHEPFYYVPTPPKQSWWDRNWRDVAMVVILAGFLYSLNILAAAFWPL